MYTKNALLFPHHAIPFLRKLRGAEWQEMVERILTFPEGHEESLAFSLMMIRLNVCLACETDSFRAMKGCDACSIQTLRRYKGTDRELLVLYNQALEDVRRHLGGKTIESVDVA